MTGFCSQPQLVQKSKVKITPAQSVCTIMDLTNFHTKLAFTSLGLPSVVVFRTVCIALTDMSMVMCMSKLE